MQTVLVLLALALLVVGLVPAVNDQGLAPAHARTHLGGQAPLRLEGPWDVLGRESAADREAASTTWRRKSNWLDEVKCHVMRWKHGQRVKRGSQVEDWLRCHNQKHVPRTQVPTQMIWDWKSTPPIGMSGNTLQVNA